MRHPVYVMTNIDFLKLISSTRRLINISCYITIKIIIRKEKEKDNLLDILSVR